MGLSPTIPVPCSIVIFSSIVISLTTIDARSSGDKPEFIQRPERHRCSLQLRRSWITAPVVIDWQRLRALPRALIEICVQQLRRWLKDGGDFIHKGQPKRAMSSKVFDEHYFIARAVVNDFICQFMG